MLVARVMSVMYARNLWQPPQAVYLPKLGRHGPKELACPGQCQTQYVPYGGKHKGTHCTLQKWLCVENRETSDVVKMLKRETKDAFSNRSLKVPGRVCAAECVPFSLVSEAMPHRNTFGCPTTNGRLAKLEFCPAS